MPFKFTGFDNVIVDFIKQCIQDPSNELEFRFSELSKSNLFPAKSPASGKNQPPNYEFKPQFTATTFNEILTTFNSYPLKSETIASVDTFYKLPPKVPGGREDSLRHTLCKTSTGDLVAAWMSKRKVKPVDVWEVNMRISFAKEEILQRQAAPHHDPYMVRRKRRTSFFDWCMRYDFTRIDTENIVDGQISRDVSYEIEIEFIPSEVTVGDAKVQQIDLDVALKHVKNCCMHLLRCIQKTPSIIQSSEKHNVLLEYSVLTKNFNTDRPFRFIGAQPETLHKRHLQLVKRTDIYCITEKYDGERFLLFINDSKNAYLIGRNLKVKCTGLVNRNDKGSILDVEYVNGTLFAFDILFHRGIDIRANVDFLLEDRLELLSGIVENFYQENKEEKYCIPVYKKPYHFSNFSAIISAYKTNEVNEDGIERDGFIYTPLKEFYPNKPKWSTLLKWKPPEMNTIDFAIRYTTGSTGEDVFELFVGDKNTKPSPDAQSNGSLVSFSPFPSVVMKKEKFLKGIEEQGIPVANDEFIGIVECRWDFTEKTFYPTRRRKDKTAPNFVTVALDVWESLTNPVHVDNLIQKTFINMRKVHNQIKSYLVNKAVDTVVNRIGDWADAVDDDDFEDDSNVGNISVLDLACGRGGDLWKWSAVCAEKTKDLRYVGFDIDKDLLKEAERRCLQVKSRYMDIVDMSFDFKEKDLCEKMADDLHGFDIVSCQFALHYFFRSPETFGNFLSTLKSALKPGGVFIATLFDGEKVVNMFKSNPQKDEIVRYGTMTKDLDEHGFKVKRLFELDKSTDPLLSLRKKKFGVPIEAVLLGDDGVILKEMTKEYLVFADLFATAMRENGFKLVETKLFTQWKEKGSYMTEVEQEYSNLHRYYMFVKD